MKDEVIAEILGTQKQILELALDNQKRVTKIEELALNNKKEIEEIKANMATKDEMSNMRNEMSDMRNEMSDMRNEINNIKNKVDKIEEETSWGFEAILKGYSDLDNRVTRLEEKRA